MTTDYIDFELQLFNYGSETYTAVVRRLKPGKKTPEGDEITLPLRFDFQKLDEAKDNPVDYGTLLTEQLFAGHELRNELARAREASSTEHPVRFRLLLSEKAHALHTLRWETLRDPDNLSTSLLTKESIVFSRAVITRGRDVPDVINRKAVVVIASPPDLNVGLRQSFTPLAPIHYDTELDAANTRLQGFAVKAVPEGKANLDDIFEKIRDERPDLLYLVCHGLPGTTPRLVLEGDSGQREFVSASDVVERMLRLPETPAMVVLASCRSAGGNFTTSGEYVSRLGTRLALEVGVPVVLAMQGDITTDSAARFLSVFFENVHKDRDIDHAVALARGAISDASDSWMPVLYMRLTGGQLWSSVRPAKRPSEEHTFENWEPLINNISRGRCTPILGFGVYEDMFGDATSLAHLWGERFQYPLDKGDQLPSIAQYLSIYFNDTMFPRDLLTAHFEREVLRRYGDRIAPERAAEMDIDDLITAAWRAVAGPHDAHRILANLPCSLYLTANVSTVLEAALFDAGVEYQSGICPWNSTFQAPPLPSELDFDRPLVYHLFGRLDEDARTSIVLTEDNYFDYLVNAAEKNPDPMIRGRAKNTSVILLGFRITDWNLRVLFRTVMKERLENETFTHVAVQVDPNQPGGADPERLYRYLDGYFRKQDVTIFRGSVSSFIDQLVGRWKETFREDLTAGRAKVRRK